MEKIGESFKNSINCNFRCTLMTRTPDGVMSTLNKPIKGSDNMVMIPKVSGVELERIDDHHDRLRLKWEDYTVDGVAEWKPSSNELEKAKMVFVGIQ